MFTISSLAKQFGLSRSTLLYYDKIGLLHPQGHKKGDYRYYSEADKTRLKKICDYRSASLPLSSIKILLDNDQKFTEELEEMTNLLEDRLLTLNREIEQRRSQQKLIAVLLGKLRSLPSSKQPTKQQWLELLANAGFSDADMLQWHRDFETTDPKGHQGFLEAVRMDAASISKIRNL